MADDGQHGKRQQGQGYVTVPAMPGPGFIVVKTKLGFGGRSYWVLGW
jgi:hypothetical protein